MSEKLLWTDAKIKAEEMGGYLATITSQEENEIIQAMIKKAELSNIWLGATDEMEEGVWQWVTGEHFEFTAWLKGEPNNSDKKEHYLCFYGENLCWNDEKNDCSNIKYYIVEKE